MDFPAARYAALQVAALYTVLSEVPAVLSVAVVPTRAAEAIANKIRSAMRILLGLKGETFQPLFFAALAPSC